MLKKMCKLLALGFASICIGSACVTPTHASSAPILVPSTEKDIILTHIYPATEGGALHELVAFYNNTNTPVDITGWCLTSRTHAPLFCFGSDGVEDAQLSPYGRATVVSSEYAASHGNEVFDGVFLGASKTSGSLVGSSGEVQLLDATGRVVDMYSWASSAGPGKGYSRATSIDHGQDGVLMYSVGDRIAVYPIVSVFGGGVVYSMIENPTESEELEGVDSEMLRITEILPNPVGSDSGSEFIELHNPSDKQVDLGMYALRVIGGASSKVYALPAGLIIEPGEYRAVFNIDIKYALNNKSGIVELLLYSSMLSINTGKALDSVEYTEPEEGVSYSYFTDTAEWIYTAEPTPGRANVRMSLAQLDDIVSSCNANQFRNPETGRCRKIETPAVQAPCKTGQYRNLETGRCRNVVAAKVATPCKEGQERNIETGRCRNSKKMTTASNAPVLAPEVTAGGVAWYVWVFAGSIILAIVGYATWEWREEIQGMVLKIKKR